MVARRCAPAERPRSAARRPVALRLDVKSCSLTPRKDIVEKAFRSLKGITQLRPTRHWLAEHVRARVFLCYLAYLLLSLLQYCSTPWRKLIRPYSSHSPSFFATASVFSRS